MRPGVIAGAGVTAASLLVGAAPGVPAAQNLSRDRIVRAGLEYVETYQTTFAYLLADETAVQRVLEHRDGSNVELTSRRTRGEVFITFLDRRRHWTIVRDVAEVDGLPAPHREDLRALLAREDPDTVARRLFAQNARYNIGAVVRNFNDPLLALLALNRSHATRFSFEVARVDRSDPRAPLAVLRFRERERPTLVRDVRGTPVFARGEITLDPATGTVRRAFATFDADGVEAELLTEFAWDERLNLWVPVMFTERYAASRARDQVTLVESHYSNYRRFEATGHLRPLAPVQ